MHRIHLAAASLNQTPLDWSGNRSRIISTIKEAKSAGIQLLCLPELCVTGYGCEDTFYSPGLQKRALKELKKIAVECKGIAVCVGLPLLHQGVLYNTSCFIVDTKIIGFVAKKHLAGAGIYYEPRWFKPWPAQTHSKTTIEGSRYPIGDIFFEIDGVRIGFEICEDAWVANRVGIDLATQGVDIILNPSASHFAFGKVETRKKLVVDGSREFGVAYVYSNLLGCEAGRIIYDGDCLIAQGGKLLAEGSRLTFADSQIVSSVVDPKKSGTKKNRKADASKAKSSDRCIKIPTFHWNSKSSSKTAEVVKAAKWESSSRFKEEEFTRAVSLGLFDYLRKSKNRGFVISLSGGVDSSAASCLVSIMVKEGILELGLKEFKERFSYIPGFSKLKNEKEIIKAILICVYQKTKNSSKETFDAAKGLAKSLSATFIELDINNLVDSYTKMVGKSLDLKLSWEKHDAALQNIQARVRSPGVWMIANLKQALLLSTSNRSEAAVGYTTMDGDTSGGLSPLGGIDKAFLRGWLRWLERSGPLGLESFPILSLVNLQQPTAELRPLKTKQTDEKDLMPYEVLDRIERFAIRDKMLPQEVATKVGAEFKRKYSSIQINNWVKRFFQLWSASQWKRERYAPSFHLDDENLDPKTWCRFPILSAGYAEELEDLKVS